MAVLIVLFAFVLEALARDTFRILRESYEIRLERASLNRELRSALDVAEAANRAKTRFLASASHDLRQPMQTLSLFAAALAMRPLDERSRDIVTHINEALYDLTAELDALLDVSKLDAGTVKAQAESFALQPLLERIVGIFRAAAEEKGLQISCRCDDDVWALTDRKLLERVVRNLIENAIKYTETGSVAVAVAHEVDSTHVLSVTDTGCGIAESEQTRVFEEFYQIQNPERDRSRGLGLGLAIVKRLADLLRLELSIRSAPGHGTCFEIAIPRAQPTAANPAPRVDPPASSTAIRVLVIDDEESLRLGMRSLLEEAGSVVQLASSTAEAVAILAATTIDLVIADFRLRGHDNGIAAIKTLRCIQPGLPALLMTGETAPERLREAQEADIPVIHKPVMPQLLLKEISKITRQHQE
jgi:signal transduction histidine kinase/CheY-like chemotaxis protein